MLARMMCNNGNGVTWYEVNGITYGYTDNNRLLDESGIPFDSAFHGDEEEAYLKEVRKAIRAANK